MLPTDVYRALTLLTEAAFSPVFEKETFEVGMSWQGTSAPTSSRVASVAHAAYPWASVGQSNRVVKEWQLGEWQTAALEKRQDRYTVSFNGVPLYTTFRTFSATPKLGFNTYGRVRLDNFKLYQLRW